MPLFLVETQWKLHVREAPRRNELEMETDELDCPWKLRKKSHKLRVEDYKSPLSS